MIPLRCAGFSDSGMSAGHSSGEFSLRSNTVLAMRAKTTGEAPAVPNDAALPGCALLSQAELRTQAMARLLGNWLGPGARLQKSFATPWRYVPGKRCNFQIELEIVPAPGARVERRQVIGKVYAKDRGAQVYRMLEEFRSHGFANGRFLVPQPLAYNARCKLLLLTWAEGELLRSLLVDGSDVGGRIEEAAGWLLQLHQCGVTGGRRLTFRRHLQTLARQKQHLAEVYPESDDVLENLLRRLEERGMALSGWTPGPTHRDYSPDHLVFSGGHITALDFDEFCQYDPMFDVAHFMAHLRLLGLRYFGVMNRFDDIAERFRAAYQAGAQGYSAERLRLYQAVAYFKLAHIVAIVVRPAAWKEVVDTFLREARQALGTLTGSRPDPAVKGITRNQERSRSERSSEGE